MDLKEIQVMPIKLTVHISGFGTIHETRYDCGFIHAFDCNKDDITVAFIFRLLRGSSTSPSTVDDLGKTGYYKRTAELVKGTVYDDASQPPGTPRYGIFPNGCTSTRTGGAIWPLAQT